jgi:hypothetical protein
VCYLLSQPFGLPHNSGQCLAQQGDSSFLCPFLLFFFLYTKVSEVLAMPWRFKYFEYHSLMQHIYVCINIYCAYTTFLCFIFFTCFAYLLILFSFFLYLAPQPMPQTKWACEPPTRYPSRFSTMLLIRSYTNMYLHICIYSLKLFLPYLIDIPLGSWLTH